MENEKKTTQAINATSSYTYNGFCFPLLPQMSYATDGEPGKSVLFITNIDETIIISIEEGMQCLDQVALVGSKKHSVESEYRTKNKYLHQLKVISVDEKMFNDLVYFRMEVTDKEGKTHICPGQMSLSPAWRQMKGAEPILKELFEGFDLIGE